MGGDRWGKGKGKGKGGKGGKGGVFNPGPEYARFLEEVSNAAPPPEGLTEGQVGMRGYANAAGGFVGLFRERFSDFLVHEVAPDGEVAVLDSLAVPDEFGLPAALLPGGKEGGGSVVGSSGEASSVEAASAEASPAAAATGSEEDAAAAAAAVAAAAEASQEAAKEEDKRRREAFVAESWEAVASGMQAIWEDAAAAAASNPMKNEEEGSGGGGGGGSAEEVAAAMAAAAWAAWAARSAVETLRDSDPSQAVRVLLPGTLDKLVRKAAHDLIKMHLPELVDADTINDPAFASGGPSSEAADSSPAPPPAAVSSSSAAADLAAPPPPVSSSSAAADLAAATLAAALAAPSKYAPPAKKTKIEDPMARFKRQEYGEDLSSYGPQPTGVGKGQGGGGQDEEEGEDWLCPKCHASVFASKKACFKCRTPKPVSEKEQEAKAEKLRLDQEARAADKLVPKCIRLWLKPPRGAKRKRLNAGGADEPVRDGRSGGSWQQRARNGWPKDKPAYLRFALYKENMDTMQAADRVATALRVRREDVTYGGTKDKRACTTQWITVYKLPALEVANSLNFHFHKDTEAANALASAGTGGPGHYGGGGAEAEAGAAGNGAGAGAGGAEAEAVARTGAGPALPQLGPNARNLLAGCFSYVAAPLSLGDLTGNRFGVTLRRLRNPSTAFKKKETETETAPPPPSSSSAAADSPWQSPALKKEAELAASVQTACSALQESGFVNFFGLQRFGSGGVSTADVGKCILNNDFEVACGLVLAARGGDHEHAALARQVWKSSHDAKLALNAMPPWMQGEVAVLSSLAQHEEVDHTDSEHAKRWESALGKVPHRLRLMYVHAWQSKLWNAAACARAERFGLVGAAVEGDLVLLPHPTNREQGQGEEQGDQQEGTPQAAPAPPPPPAAAAAVVKNRSINQL